MFGAFKPSAPLSGGLLWKIPWRLSPPQKLRQRRRLRKVDNVVSTLSSALSRQYQQSLVASQTSSSHPTRAPNPQDGTPSSKATPAELEVTAEGQRILTPIPASQLERRHGRGPKLGDYVPGSNQSKLLSEYAKEQGTIRLIERWKAEMPREEEMLPKDKYTIFDRKEKKYRKGIHKLPKWTRVSQRLNPPGF